MKVKKSGLSNSTTQTLAYLNQNRPIHNSKKLEKIKPPYSNALPVQRMKLLSKLVQVKKLTTMQLRHSLGIMHPAGRVRELRHQGHDITTHWVYEKDLNGVTHRMGQYIYIGRKNKKKEGK